MGGRFRGKEEGMICVAILKEIWIVIDSGKVDESEMRRGWGWVVFGVFHSLRTIYINI